MFNTIKTLDVDFDNSSDFWKKSEEERYEYFKNACYSYMIFLKSIDTQTGDMDLKSMAAMHFANICTLLVYLMTTDEERETDVETRWFNKITTETDNLIMLANQDKGQA
tara:strand:+ start:1361 stop:1687 length:327 start_codon:yes stop_codon:yes gene_type:complete